MRIDAGQHLRMDQRMKLAPRMIQSMEILQLSTQALEERLEQELASNPTLEIPDPSSDLDDPPAQPAVPAPGEGERELIVRDDGEDKSHRDDFERLDNLTQEYHETWDSNIYDSGDHYPRYRASDLDRDAKMEAMSNAPARPESFYEQLIEQWHMSDPPDDLRALGEFLIGFIDEDGYIRSDESSLVKQAPTGTTPDKLRQALTLLQLSLDPPGLAARDLRECLLLQIDARIGQTDANPPATDMSVERLIVSDYLKDVEANRLPRIAEKAGLSIERIKQALVNLRQFHPHPGRDLLQEKPQTIIPDAIVEFDDAQDRYTARLTQDRLPNVQINEQYLKMVRDRQIDRKTREFVGNNLRSARWLLEAVQQRYATLLRVVQVVVDHQRDFFDQGPQALKPLPMTLVADQLGIHVATVSRAVADKYLQTPRGILPLRMFFSGGTATDAGDAMSWTAVQAKLKEIIDAEDKSNPLSDDELVDKLKTQGIEIARRTVAKYRKELHIMPARQRKQF